MQCTWRVSRVQAVGDYTYTLELHSGEGDDAETAYVDISAWEDRHGDCHLTVVGMEPDAVSQSAAAWVREQPEHELGAVVIDWDLRRAS